MEGEVSYLLMPQKYINSSGSEIKSYVYCV